MQLPCRTHTTLPYFALHTRWKCKGLCCLHCCETRLRQGQLPERCSSATMSCHLLVNAGPQQALVHPQLTVASPHDASKSLQGPALCFCIWTATKALAVLPVAKQLCWNLLNPGMCAPSLISSWQQPSSTAAQSSSQLNPLMSATTLMLTSTQINPCLDTNYLLTGAAQILATLCVQPGILVVGRHVSTSLAAGLGRDKTIT